MKRNSHCSYCGHGFEDVPWPRTCVQCKKISYINPLPVVVLVVPVEGNKKTLWERSRGGVLTVRRGDPKEPGSGKLALPGGFQEVGETWRQGAVRELREETGLVFDAKCVRILTVETSIEDNIDLIFGETPMISRKDLDVFKPNPEVLELVIVSEPQELAFPTHTEVLRNYFNRLT